jgi:hypothetical protein
VGSDAHHFSSFAITRKLRKEIVITHVSCPGCEVALDWPALLRCSVFYEFDGGYKEPCVIFDCEHCDARVYFRVFGNQLETGLLGCSPVFDPIPSDCFTINGDLSIKVDVEAGELTIVYESSSRTVPTARKYRK